MVTFSHLDAGTPESQWRADLLSRSVSELDLGFDELIVVAAHPDDETLGAGGLIGRAHRAGARVTIIIATDGEASHPQSPTHTPERLGELRRAEVRRAMTVLAPAARLHFLAIPDSTLREQRHILTTLIAEILDDLPTPGARILLVAPWSGDGHRDHRIVAETVGPLCAQRGVRHLGYPIWAWHWGAPDALPWPEISGLSLSGDEVRAKQSAIRLHETQIAPLSDSAGDEAVIHEGMREHFERNVELFVEEPATTPASMPALWFDAFYERNDDPWGFETRWYEKRKRAVLMASLPDDRLGDVLELGCATGLITQELARRADLVVAVDAAVAALEIARARPNVGGADVTFVLGQIPGDWPSGTFDTVVLSEIGYYLSLEHLRTTIRLIEGCLAPDGCLVACHWRHPLRQYPLTGDEVHAELRRSAQWEAIVRHEEPDFILEVFARVPAASVAQREGLV